ncbi:hypothetical protein Riv7116_4390 [Rivularia sp. PCC 7116]|uniref:hypothetical protein n=1 Tax=Rivularia sp. PCC 7116 TaxID=373994 RepID=UPI00029F38FD|nr:hypothetical protein [Rivularia sp. PCC 7116]AFY56812.1 hypothetical protein Riv7116_4390 [Rivularia sp. PCC 7116]
MNKILLTALFTLQLLPHSSLKAEPVRMLPVKGTVESVITNSVSNPLEPVSPKITGVIDINKQAFFLAFDKPYTITLNSGTPEEFKITYSGAIKWDGKQSSRISFKHVKVTCTGPTDICAGASQEPLVESFDFNRNTGYGSFATSTTTFYFYVPSGWKREIRGFVRQISGEYKKVK